LSDIIKIDELKKSFNEVAAVDGLSFSVKRGELFAFLGVNGAGKSTTINIISGTLKKDGGSVVIDGADLERDPEHIKRSLGVVFQGSVLDSNLSVFDNLRFRASLYGITGKDFDERLSYLSDVLDFKNLLNRTVKKLSGGQRRRIDIARALLHRPKLLILDEPTTGLDPQTRKTLWNVIRELQKNENMTVFLTTHYMEEAAAADYVIIIDAGKISAKGTPHELKTKYTKDYITLYGANEDGVKQLSLPYEKDRDEIRIFVKNTQQATLLITKYPELFVDYEITKGKMDDVFLAVTGKIKEEDK